MPPLRHDVFVHTSTCIVEVGSAVVLDCLLGTCENVVVVLDFDAFEVVVIEDFSEFVCVVEILEKSLLVVAAFVV